MEFGAGLVHLLDLISSEYGWADKEILALPYSRARQIGRAISKRHRFERIYRHSYAQLFFGILTGNRLPDLNLPADDETGFRDSEYVQELWWEKPPE